MSQYFQNSGPGILMWDESRRPYFTVYLFDLFMFYISDDLLRSTTSAEPDGAVLPVGEQVDGLRLDPRAVAGTEAVGSLAVNVDTSTVHLGGAPGIRVAIYGGARRVDSSSKGEGEDTVATRGGATRTTSWCRGRRGRCWWCRSI